MHTPAIQMLPDPCWVLIYPDGSEFDFTDLYPHFDTEAEARDAAPRYAKVGRMLVPKPLIEKCYVATAACGYQHDEDGEGIEHADNPEHLEQVLFSADWTRGPDGSMGCGGCAPCKALTADGPVPEVAGQQTLPGVAAV